MSRADKPWSSSAKLVAQSLLLPSLQSVALVSYREASLTPKSLRELLLPALGVGISTGSNPICASMAQLPAQCSQGG